MRVFVTGASGWIGSAVVDELIGAGHHVLGLTRTDEGAEALSAAGAEIHRGSLADLDGLRSASVQADAVIHTAFNHDYAKFAGNAAEDQRAIEAIGGVLEGSERPLLVTSGVARLVFGRTATEEDRLPANPAFPRKSEDAAAALVERGIRASIIRPGLSVHGRGEHGVMANLIGLARQKGVSAYIGEGLNRWPAVHRLDAARLYRLALERGAEPSVYHAVAEEGVAFKAIAEVIGRRLNIPVISKPPEEAFEHFGLFGLFAGIDAPTSSARTQSLLDWRPQGPGLIADVDHPIYFAA